MFLSAVFYPVEALPEMAGRLVLLNPLALSIEIVRKLTVKGEMPSIPAIVVSIVIAVMFAEASLRIFLKAKRGFSDVL